MRRGTHSFSASPTGTIPLGDGSQVYDPNAKRYIKYSGITEIKKQQAVNRLVINLKRFGLWDKYYTMWLYVPTGANDFKINLKNPGTFTLTQYGTVYADASNGIASDGSTGYFDTGFGFNPNNGFQMDAENFGFDCWMGQLNQQNTSVLGWLKDSTLMYLAPRVIGSQTVWGCSADGIENAFSTTTNWRIFSANAPYDGYVQLFANGSLVDSVSWAPTYLDPEAGNFYLLAQNLDGVGAVGFCTNRCYFFGFRTAITDTDAYNLNQIALSYIAEV